MKKNFLKFFIPFCALMFVFGLGLFFGLSSWDKNLYVEWSPSKGRGLAGEDSAGKILNLSYDQLSAKAHLVLFSKSRIIKQDDMTAFYLGNFIGYDSNSKNQQFICQIFPMVEFSFSALGVNLSGEEGLMIIQSPCNMESEDFIGPFWIPHQQILTHLGQRSFALPEKETFIRFYNASIVLTSSWLLKSARFFKKEETNNSFLIRFIPGADNPYFELSLKEKTEKPEPVVEEIDL